MLNPQSHFCRLARLDRQATLAALPEAGERGQVQAPPGAAFAVQERALGCHHENLVFIKPPFYALLMWPLAQLPFVPAF